MSGRRWTETETRILREVYPNSTWKQILAALPGRDKYSCRNRTQQIGIHKVKDARIPWTGAEVTLLRKLWPKAPRKEIERAIPMHRWPTISRKACEIKVKRDPARRVSRYRLMRELREARRAAGIKQTAIAALVGTHSVQIAKWERGETVPRFASFIDWAEAVGFRVELVRI